jgi:hypothetical protein
MSQPFRRTPIVAVMAREGTEQAFQPVPSAGHLTRLAIGVVAAAGIVAAIGTAAAGPADPAGEVVRHRHSARRGA